MKQDEPGKWCMMWESWIGGRRGRGDAFMTYEQAQSVADWLGKKYPAIRYWVELAETPAPAGNPPAEAGKL